MKKIPGGAGKGHPLTLAIILTFIVCLTSPPLCRLKILLVKRIFLISFDRRSERPLCR